MKVRYSLDYLKRIHKTQANITTWGNAQAQALQEKYGVPFSHGVGAGDIYTFSPYYDETTQEISDPEILAMILGKTKNERYFTNFILIANETGLPLKTVVGASKWLVGHQYAVPGKNLGGQVASIRWFPGACRVYMQDAQAQHDLERQTRNVRRLTQKRLAGAH